MSIAGNGFCGYSSMAYCLTGDKYRFQNIINDSLLMFYNYPVFFENHTDFGLRSGSGNSITTYEILITNAVERLQYGDILSSESDKMLWCQEGHFFAISYLYDISIFVYNTAINLWSVYNETGSKGYICILFNHTGEHFEVLEGRVPRETVKAAINITHHNTVDVVHLLANKNYSMCNVLHWPNGIPEINLIVEKSLCLCEEVNNNQTFVAEATISKTKILSLSKMSCDIQDCTYKCNKIRAMNMHKIKCHRSSNKKCSISHTEKIEKSSLCIKKFVNLANHKICRGKSVVAVQGLTISAMDLTGYEANIGEVEESQPHIVTRTELLSENYDKVQCSKCRKFFKDLSKHKRCRGVSALTSLISSENSDELFLNIEKKNFSDNCFQVPTIMPRRSKRLHNLLSSSCSNSSGPEEVNSDIDIAITKIVKKKLHRIPCRKKLFKRKCSRPMNTSSNGSDSSIDIRNKVMTQVSETSNILLANTNEQEQMFCCDEENESHIEEIRSSADIQLDAGVMQMIYKKNTKERKIMKEILHKYYPKGFKSEPISFKHDKLKKYHDKMLNLLENVVTLRRSPEALEVIEDPLQMNDEKRKFKWSTKDQEQLSFLTSECKKLDVPDNWTWAGKDESLMGKANMDRMTYCIEKELVTKVIDCPQCQSTGLLIGEEQVRQLKVCYDCSLFNEHHIQYKKKELDAWAKVKPKTGRQYPKRIEKGCEHEDLPAMTPGDCAVISPVFPVVTVKRDGYQNLQLKQEAITLQQDPSKTWCKILPRTNLRNRYIVIERRLKDNTRKYFCADAERVGPNLRYLFKNHPEYKRMKSNGELNLSEEALRALDPNSELAEVDSAPESHQEIFAQIERKKRLIGNVDNGLEIANQRTSLSENHVFAMNKLYLNDKEMMRLRKEGKIEILDDNQLRKPVYNVSSTIAFPHLYANGEAAPSDCGDVKLAKKMLKKQTMWSYDKTNADNTNGWVFPYAGAHAHQMQQKARIDEFQARGTAAWYASQHPEVLTKPRDVLDAFKEGCNEHGLMDKRLPQLTMALAKLPNTRERWYAEKLGIEELSKNLGEANIFLTLNHDPRAWPDVRELLFFLEHRKLMPKNHPFEKNTEKFTQLMNKFAPLVELYLYRKTSIILNAFLDIIGVNNYMPSKDWSKEDRTKTGWIWRRVEFTHTRGVQHWHMLIKVPNVLDTALLGRLVQNGRVVRQEMKMGNIKKGCEVKAWEIIEMGLLADRYCVLLAESLSTSSFFDREMDVDEYDEEKVIPLEPLRDEFVTNYMKGNITPNTHPIMRCAGDKECDSNVYMEVAKVASVSCIHNCIKKVCGGDKQGQGCRFDFPKKLMKHTVVALFQVNNEQMEARIILRRTCNRVPALNKFLLNFFRSNHDLSILIDDAHRKRYVTKYVTKNEGSEELVNNTIEELSAKRKDPLPPNMKNTLSSLILASGSQTNYISAQQLGYEVLDLPKIKKSFNDVKVIGFYNRATIAESRADKTEIVYSDRTEYSAYAERLANSVVLKGINKEEMENMNFLTFAETISHKWKQKDSCAQELGKKRKFKSRDVSSGYWILGRRRQRIHVRTSTILNTEPAKDYQYVDSESSELATDYFQLDFGKRKQLYRAYYEMVMHVAWAISPDKTFLSQEMLDELSDRNTNIDENTRYSLLRLEAFHKVYMELYGQGKVAPLGSRWHRDNQYCYSMFLTNMHNNNVKLQRMDNKGKLNAQFDPAEEFDNENITIRPALFDDADDYDFPSVMNFLPVDTFHELTKQPPPTIENVVVAFPMQHDWRELEQLCTNERDKFFLADPPHPLITYNHMTVMQKFAVDIATVKNRQILYIVGPAGCGKSTIALEICRRKVNKVQAGAVTGKASSLFRGPTVHSMFGWSHSAEHDNSASITLAPKKLEDLRVRYENIETFVIDEVNAMSASALALLHEQMNAIFNPKQSRNKDGDLLSFGGKQMIFLGDIAQLRPVMGAAIYDDNMSFGNLKFGAQAMRAKKGHELFLKYLVPSCIMLQRGQRNTGLLGQIVDRLRNGQQTEDDLYKLTSLKRRFPNVQVDVGIHYKNEACTLHNWRKEWESCSKNEKRAFLCHAEYYQTVDNQIVVEGLASLPGQLYSYAPDILFISEGACVRLIQNINVSAGLVNSAMGIIVKVIYDNADMKALIEGKKVSPYCLICDFPDFRGFCSLSDIANERLFPFICHPTWVPIYKKHFNIMSKDIPRWIRDKQKVSQCYRNQFPLDLADHLTAHRAQGQTLHDCLIGVDIGIDRPDAKLVDDMGSILYVALTRATKLENLLVANISPNIWQKLGKSGADESRRKVEQSMKKGALKLAEELGIYREAKEESEWKSESSNTEKEWKEIVAKRSLSANKRNHTEYALQEFRAIVSNFSFNVCVKPVLSERHIGLDQGVNNFAIAVVDKLESGCAKIMWANNYTDLGLKKNFTASDIAIALRDKTELFVWMQVPGHISTDDYINRVFTKVDRVIVHVEQMCIKNQKAKQFGMELGKLLQRLAGDPVLCIVKLSKPNFYCPRGVTFKMGQRIVEALELKPIAESRDTYTERKSMSAKIFRYIMQLNVVDSLEDMGIAMADNELRQHWNNIFQMSDDIKPVKFDDLGDALLHACSEIMCGTSNYRQLIPSPLSLHNNRTVAVSIFPDVSYFVVCHCTWNSMTFENMGCFETGIGMGYRHVYFKSKDVIRNLVNKMPEQLTKALSDMSGGDVYTPVDHIKVIIKQQTCFEQRGLNTRLEAGAITSTAATAIRTFCDEVMGQKSGLIDRKDKVLGRLYMRTDRVTGYKYQVQFSTGKHTNAILTMLNWFHEKLPSYLSSRKLHLSEEQKYLFYDMIRDVAKKDCVQVEMMHLSPLVLEKLRSNNLSFCQAYHTRNYADLLLIAMNKNQQHVQAIAANYRQQRSIATNTRDSCNNKAMNEGHEDVCMQSSDSQLFNEKELLLNDDI